jgi:hypothetical protein
MLHRDVGKRSTVTTALSVAGKCCVGCLVNTINVIQSTAVKSGICDFELEFENTFRPNSC